MSYNNVANQVAKDIQVNRNQIEVRATWLALIYDEMLRAGIKNTEEILRKAITRYGTIKGENIKNACADPQDMRQFADKTPSKTGQATFNMDPVSSGYDDVHLSKYLSSLALPIHIQNILNTNDFLAVLAKRFAVSLAKSP